MPVVKCSKCGKVVSTRFPIHDCKPPQTESPEETIKKAMQELSNASRLPKDWSNRILR